jgi:flagellar biosynthesis/type III secretory pathway M-ring protein FliF/YscJ
VVLASQASLPAIEATPVQRADATGTQLDQMRQIARADPATVANVVKAWVGDAKA